MTENAHARIEELLAARALGGLAAEDEQLLARERATHGTSCEECARLEREYAEVAGLLAFALEPLPLREGFEEDVLTRAAGSPPVSRRPNPFLRRILAVGVAAALVAAGWVLHGAVKPAAGPGFGIIPFEGSAKGTLTVAFRPGEPGAYLIGTGLLRPPKGKRYELWLIEDGRPISAGCFVPARGAVREPVNADLSEADLLAVTVEPASCPDTPTSEPILTATPQAAQAAPGPTTSREQGLA